MDDDPAQIVMIETGERDQALGAYMDAWSGMESLLSFLMADLLSCDFEDAGHLMGFLPTRQLADFLKILGARHLVKEGSEKIDTICEKLIRRNTRRNRIVHGRWIYFTVVDGGKVTKREWVRNYTPSDPTLAILSIGAEKLYGDYNFRISDLKKATNYVQELTQLVSKTKGEIANLRLPPQFAPVLR